MLLQFFNITRRINVKSHMLLNFCIPIIDLRFFALCNDIVIATNYGTPIRRSAICVLILVIFKFFF